MQDSIQLDALSRHLKGED